MRFVASQLPKGLGMGQHGKLTDRKINSLKPAASGKHYDTWERDGFGVRVSDRGTRTSS
jgi:hypothetical protein